MCCRCQMGTKHIPAIAAASTMQCIGQQVLLSSPAAGDRGIYSCCPSQMGCLASIRRVATDKLVLPWCDGMRQTAAFPNIGMVPTILRKRMQRVSRHKATSWTSHIPCQSTCLMTLSGMARCRTSTHRLNQRHTQHRCVRMLGMQFGGPS